MVRQGNLFIYSTENKSTLYEVREGQIVEQSTLPFPAVTRYVISSQGWIAALRIKRRRYKKSFIYLARIDHDFQIVSHRNIRIPEGFIVRALAIKESILYLSGYHKNWESRELACFIDLEEEEPDFRLILIPARYRMTGKAIDDIMILGEKMILVDNFIFPKYLFEYDISRLKKPVLRKIIKLPNHGVYEHIKSGSMNESWILLFSSSININGAKHHLSVLDAVNYQEKGTITSVKSLLDDSTKHWFHDYALQGDTLYLACGEKGIGYLDLNKKISRKNVKYLELPGITFVEKLLYLDSQFIIFPDANNEIMAVSISRS